MQIDGHVSKLAGGVVAPREHPVAAGEEGCGNLLAFQKADQLSIKAGRMPGNLAEVEGQGDPGTIPRPVGDRATGSLVAAAA